MARWCAGRSIVFMRGSCRPLAAGFTFSGTGMHHGAARASAADVKIVSSIAGPITNFKSKSGTSQVLPSTSAGRAGDEPIELRLTTAAWADRIHSTLTTSAHCAIGGPHIRSEWRP
jgi:hypothetical protein